MSYTLWHGDCLEEMNRIEAGSVDAIICDLPFGVTNCSWDTLIPFDPLWKQYKRVIKRNGAVVLFGSQPFTTLLIASSPEFGTKKQWFRYCWTWDKKITTGFLDVAKKPMKAHEDICIFYSSLPTYNPQMETRTPDELKRDSYKAKRANDLYKGEIWPEINLTKHTRRLQRYPASVIRISALRNGHPERLGHPVQKPAALMEYLIRTYTNEGDLILDNTAGSGSTLEAAMRCNRRSIGIEKDLNYYNVASQRLERVAAELRGELTHLPMFAGQ